MITKRRSDTMTTPKNVTKKFPPRMATAIRKAVRVLETKGCLEQADLTTCMVGCPKTYTTTFNYNGGGPRTFKREVYVSTIQYWALRQHMNNTGRKGAEWTIEFDTPAYTPSSYQGRDYIPGRYIPNKVSGRMVAVSVPRGADPKLILATRVMNIITQNPLPVKQITFASIRMPSQWTNADLPTLV